MIKSIPLITEMGESNLLLSLHFEWPTGEKYLLPVVF